MENKLDQKGEWDEKSIAEVVTEFLQMAHKVVAFQTNVLGKISLSEFDSLGLDEINNRMQKLENILILLRGFPETIKQITKLALKYEGDKSVMDLIAQFGRLRPTIDKICSDLEIHDIIYNDGKIPF